MQIPIIELALAVSEKPLSADTLVDWGMARPSELFAWLDRERAAGRLIAEDASSGPSRFRLSEDARAQSLARATIEDFRILTRQPALVPELLGTARREAAHAGPGIAHELYRAVFHSVSPESFPGGSAGFIAAVVESVRLYRSIYSALGNALERAIDLATENGDLASQAELLAAYALGMAQGHYQGDVQAVLARARAAAEAVGGSVLIEVVAYIAISLVFSGRLREGIVAFESLLGDVPEDSCFYGGPLILRESAHPAAATMILAEAYSQAGQHPRAIEILHQLIAIGDQLGETRILDEAKLFLGLLHAMRGEIDAAIEFAEPAWIRYTSGDCDPAFTWFAGVAIALVRAAQGRLPEARAALDAAAVAWRRAGSPALIRLVSGPFEVFEQLEAAGEGLPTEIDLIAEAERLTRMPLALGAGITNRFLAARAARVAKTDEELAAAAERFERAITLLRTAGATYDLARAYREAATLAERRGRTDEAHRRLSEAEKACPSARDNPAHDNAGLRAVVLDLGRLPVAGPEEGFWGRIAARLCEGLGSERCAVVELVPEPRLLAARGGTRAWQQEILGRAQSAPLSPQVIRAASGPGQLVLVPFAAPDLGRRGFVALENLYSQPTVGPGDGELFDVLGVQLGVLLGNVTLWQELARTRERLEHEVSYFREIAPAASESSRMVAHSPAMREVLGLVARVAPSTVTVLITGETGVGKEVIAHEIHRQSPRHKGPFIAVHVASLAPDLVASGLFGHERGAFTGATEQTKGRFELADGGTLLLDEVSELSLEHQVKLLRVLQEGTFERVGGSRLLRSDFRLIAATNRDLKAEVRAGRFREDLYFRLCAFPICVPPLRERREEIPTLALYFMERVGRARGVRFEGIGESDMQRLLGWDWPGNVRELGHVIERAGLLSEPPRLRIPNLEDGLVRPSLPAHKTSDSQDSLMTLAEAERRYIGRVLEHTGGRITGTGGAAQILALKPSTLNFRIRKLGLNRLLGDVRSRKSRG